MEPICGVERDSLSKKLDKCQNALHNKFDTKGD